METKERNSVHELLRIFAMFLIVWYHLVSYCLYCIPHDPTYDVLYQATIPTLHIGVILFLLITGYYGINPSVVSFCRLIVMTMVYFLPLEIIRCIYSNDNVLHSLMFLSNTPYWFVRSYLFLYLISPILNKFLANSSRPEINRMLVFMAIIAVYFGVTQGDPSLKDGKNIANFMFLYLLGNTIRYYKSHWLYWKKIYIILIYLMLNATLMLSLIFFPRNTNIGSYIWLFSGYYCSPILIFNAILVFFLFSGLKFQSNIVNYISNSMFAVYLIHSQPIVQKYVTWPVCMKILDSTPPPLLTFVTLGGMAVGIMIICVCLDKVLYPIWSCSIKLVNKIMHRA